MKAFFIKQWFLIGLLLVLIVGFGLSGPLESIAEIPELRSTLLFMVLFVMALPIATSELGKAFRTPWAAVYATALNFVLLPVVAWLTSLGFDPFMGEGLVIAAVVPCTLASAVVWTRRAGGNDSVAIFVMLLTNLFCFLLTPFWLWVFSGRTEISVTGLAGKLALLVVLPMVLAQFFRQLKPVGTWSTRYKSKLSSGAQIGILIMVMIGAVQTGVKFSQSETAISWTQLGLMLLAVNAVHLAVLFFGVWSARLLGFRPPEQIAIGIAGSQKTLMVGLNTAVDLQRSIVPMLLFHICQLVFDTLIVDAWRVRHPLQESDADETETEN